MYLPKSKYLVKHTKGGDFLNPDGSSYIGPYIETYKGNVYKGREFTSNSVKLVDIRAEDEFVGSAKFKNDRITPTEKDYKKGVFNRYFIQDKRNNKIIEVSQKNFTKLNLELYTAGAVVEWTLKGPAENINKDPYIYFGAEAKNKEAILEAEKTIKQLSSFVLNNRKFVV